MSNKKENFNDTFTTSRSAKSKLDTVAKCLLNHELSSSLSFKRLPCTLLNFQLKINIQAYIL